MHPTLGLLPIDVFEVALRIAERSPGDTSAGYLACPVCRRGLIAYAFMRQGELLLVECSTAGCVQASHPVPPERS